jgi:hypothetical protein
MRAVATGAALTGAMVLAGWSAVRAAVARIERNPDPLPRDLLAREPKGKEVLINRPDGTALRAVVAGEGPPVVLAHGGYMTLAAGVGRASPGCSTVPCPGWGRPTCQRFWRMSRPT